MVKTILTFFVILTTLTFSMKLFYKIPNDIIAGNKSQIVLTLMDDFEMLYMGEAVISPSSGEILTKNPVEFDMGSAIMDYKAPQSPGKVEFKVNVQDEMLKFSVEVLPDYTAMKEQFFEVKEFGGYVSVKRKGEDLYKPVSSGEKLFEGDQLQVLEDSYAVLEGPGGNQIEIAPNSEVLIKKVRSDSKTVFIRIEVVKGEVVSKVMKEMFNTVLLVDSQSVTAGVRGTILGVEADDDLSIRNYEGEVWVRTNGMYMDLPQMMMMKFGKDTLREFDRAQKEMMRRFNELEKDIMNGFEEQAKQLLSNFGMEESFRIDMRQFVKPLDKQLKTFDDMINSLRKRWRKRKGGD